MLTLVTGGARSGKSRHAEALIAHAPQVLYIATSQIFDDEMAARIQHHAGRAALASGNQYRDFGVDRPLHRRIIPVVRRAVAPQRKQQVGYHGGDAFQQNRLLRGDIRGDQFIKLLPALGGAPVRGPAVAVVLVTNEVGMGIVPENRLARHFRDIAGRVNQRLAAAADEVWLVVSGIGVKIK